VPAIPPEHPQRRRLALEIHARPPEALRTPALTSYLAVAIEPGAREAERAHLVRLAKQHGVTGPAEGATHWRAGFQTAQGPVTLKWERHGEFSGYTAIVDAPPAPGATAASTEAAPFAHSPCIRVGEAWWRAIPGETLAAVALELRSPGRDEDDAAALQLAFGTRSPVGAWVGDGAARVFTDFWLHEDGQTRFLVFDHTLAPAQAGRVVQRLFEIEAYRVLALLALPIAQRQGPRIDAIEGALAELTDGIAQGGRSAASAASAAPAASAQPTADDERLLERLTTMAAEVESGIAASQFRFGACAAYHGLVQRRIAELREQRLAGVQTLEEFMGRRLTPAVQTCATVQARLQSLAERIGQASALLSTRVDIARERQNQQLLASMDRRARAQLRLQQTVEGLSVAAICYYVLGLLGYGLKGLKSAGVPLNPDLLVGLAVPVVALVLLWALRRARQRLSRNEPDPLQD
jgi:uncharacterized membrane-anchored protein